MKTKVTVSYNFVIDEGVPIPSILFLDVVKYFKLFYALFVAAMEQAAIARRPVHPVPHDTVGRPACHARRLE